ncbi:nitroreductase family protein [Brevibacillus brevis]|uniref:nitroreductase family protein n=1 Tax=Brevibacillus brevis TaxID=1393 RepID=UPI00163B7CB8|nr:nitroreductase [Lysinibacillus sp. SDF0063]
MTVVSIAKIIRERRSIKKDYKPDTVPEELILELLNDAVYAPNHGIREPWRFMFVSSEKKEAFVEKLITCYPQEAHQARRDMYNQPAAYLVVIMKEDPRQKQWEEDFSATAALIQNFQLLAWERGLGVVWKTNAHNWDPKAHDILGVAPGEKIVGFLHLGFFDQENVPAARTRTPAEEKFTRFE